jgi:hypothetical protein
VAKICGIDRPYIPPTPNIKTIKPSVPRKGIKAEVSPSDAATQASIRLLLPETARAIVEVAAGRKHGVE